jgi:tripartite-type tricarboxylate transporter receptor subunit TctC
MVEMGFDVVGGTPAEFERTIQADYERYGVVVRKAGIKLE